MAAPRAQPQSAGAAEHGQQNSKAKLARGERAREREREMGGEFLAHFPRGPKT